MSSPRRASSIACGIVLAILCAALPTRPIAAQTVERPVAFDSAGRLLAITPPLAARLRLAPPAWPVGGRYVEARLYRSGEAGDHVLVVRLDDGSLERRPIGVDALTALRVAIAQGSAAAPVGEVRADEISEPARGRFIRNQLIAAATIYGGSVAELADGPTAGAAAYMLSVGGAFFTSAALARHLNVSRAQDHLTTDAALRGSAMARALAFSLGVDGRENRYARVCPVDDYCYDEYVGSDDREQDILAASILVGGIGGSIAAFRYGRGLTDGEATASTYGSTALALTTAGALGVADLYDQGRGARRIAAATIVGAGLAGYPLGLAYARRSAYRVTSGDVGALGVAGVLGAATAGSLIASSEKASVSLVSTVLTAGYLAGLAVGDATLVRAFDFTDGEAGLVGLGAAAGAVMAGGALILAADSGVEGTVAGLTLTGGAILGTIATVRLIEPLRAGRIRVARRDTRSIGMRGERPHVRLSPEGVALAASGMRGRHSILRVTF